MPEPETIESLRAERDDLKTRFAELLTAYQDQLTAHVQLSETRFAPPPIEPISLTQAIAVVIRQGAELFASKIEESAAKRAK